jgi:hypothetical protein
LRNSLGILDDGSGFGSGSGGGLSYFGKDGFGSGEFVVARTVSIDDHDHTDIDIDIDVGEVDSTCELEKITDTSSRPAANATVERPGADARAEAEAEKVNLAVGEVSSSAKKFAIGNPLQGDLEQPKANNLPVDGSGNLSHYPKHPKHPHTKLRHIGPEEQAAELSRVHGHDHGNDHAHNANSSSKLRQTKTSLGRSKHNI